MKVPGSTQTSDVQVPGGGGANVAVGKRMDSSEGGSVGGMGEGVGRLISSTVAIGVAGRWSADSVVDVAKAADIMRSAKLQLRVMIRIKMPLTKMVERDMFFIMHNLLASEYFSCI